MLRIRWPEAVELAPQARTVGQDGDRLLEVHRAELAELPPDVRPPARRLGLDPVDEQQPAPRLARSFLHVARLRHVPTSRRLMPHAPIPSPPTASTRQATMPATSHVPIIGSPRCEVSASCATQSGSRRIGREGVEQECPDQRPRGRPASRATPARARDRDPDPGQRRPRTRTGRASRPTASTGSCPIEATRRARSRPRGRP